MFSADLERKALSLLLLTVILSSVVMGLFQAIPALDIETARLFCHAQAFDGTLVGRHCARFDLRDNIALTMVRKVLFYAPPLAAAALVIDALYQRLTFAPWNRGNSGRELMAALAYLIVPIGLVNGILKAYSGRPRPYQTFEFGGNMAFMPVGDFSGACTSNCSFISGEAAAAGWLLCLAPMLKDRGRPRLAAAVVCASFATPLLRVAMGGHFLSDAILGWLAGATAYPFVVASRNLWRAHQGSLIKSRT